MPREWKSARSPMVEVGQPSTDGIPVRAVIADLSVIDHDGDTYAPGAFRLSGKQVISQWGHSAAIGHVGAMPVGEGAITERAGMAIFNGVLFKEMQAAKDLAALLRRRGATQEWSYAYDVIDSGTDWHDGKSIRILKAVIATEVSPVLKGAGVGTSTVSVGDMEMKSARLRYVDWLEQHDKWWQGGNRCLDCDHSFAVIEKAQLTMISLEMEKPR